MLFAKLRRSNSDAVSFEDLSALSSTATSSSKSWSEAPSVCIDYYNNQAPSYLFHEAEKEQYNRSGIVIGSVLLVLN